MASLHHNAIKQKYKHIFTQFSKIAKCSFGPKIKLRYGQCDFVTYLKIGKYEFRDVKVMGIHLIFEWPKSVMAQDRKMVTKFSFKIIAKNGRHFSRDIEMNITSSNKSTGFDSFLPMCELNGDYFLENDQLTVEVEGIVEPPSIIEQTKKIILRIPYISKMKKSHSSVLFKHDLGLQWRIHTEYYEGDRPGYDVYLEAVGPNYKWICDAHTRLRLVRNFNDIGFNRTKGLKLSNNCTTLHIGQYDRDEVFDPANGFVDGFDTLTFQFLLHIYYINGLHSNYDDCIRGMMPIVMNKLPDDGVNIKSNLSFEIKVPKLSEFKSVAYSVLDYAQNLFWVAFLRVEKITINNELETEALGVYIHCFDPNGMTNWSCEGDVSFILNAKRNENKLERRLTHTFSHKENTIGYNNMVLMKEIVYSKRNYLQNNGINVVFKIDCKPRQVIDEPIRSINIPATIDTQGSIKMIVKDFSKFSDVQVTPDWVDIGNAAFKIMVMTHHKLFHNTVVDKVLAFYIKCDSNRKPTDWRCNTQVALKMKCHLPEMTDLVLKFEHQFSKDIVCFGFEEFLLVSVILNPAHGFICNDSIELEAVIEIANEKMEDHHAVNIDTNGEKHLEVCIDEKLDNLWCNQKLDEAAIEGKMVNDRSEKQSESRSENIPVPDANAAFITQEIDVPEKLAPEKDFNYEAIEACASTLICDEESPEDKVVFIKREIVDENYYNKALIVCNKEEEVIMKKENDYDQASIDFNKVDPIENPDKMDGFNNIEVEPQAVNLVVTINGKVKEEEPKYEQQLANEDCMEEKKLVAMEDEEHTQAANVCVYNQEPLVASEEVETISKVEDDSGQLDNKQSLTVENLHLKCTHESEDIVPDENHINLISDGVNVTLKKDFEEHLDEEVYKEEEKLEALEYGKTSNGAGDCEEKIVLEVSTASNTTINPVDLVDDKDLYSPAEKELCLVINLDHKDEISYQNCEVNINQQDKDITDKNQDLMNDSNRPENKPLDENHEEINVGEVHVTDEKKELGDSKEKDKLEAFEDEKHSQAEKDGEDKKEQLTAFEKNATVSELRDNLDSKTKLDSDTEVTCPNLKIELKQEDTKDLDEKSDPMNVYNSREDELHHETQMAFNDENDVTDEKAESCIEEQHVASQEVETVSKLEEDLGHLNKMDLLSPAVQSFCSDNKLDSETEVTCPNLKIELKQEDTKDLDEKSDPMNVYNNPEDELHHETQMTFNDENDVTDEKAESCIEEQHVASQEVETVSKLEEDLGHLNKMDLLSPVVQSFSSDNKIDSKDEVSCMNKSDELRKEKEGSYPKDNEGLSRIKRNNLKDVMIPKIIIDKYEDFFPLEENKITCSSVEATKDLASNDSSCSVDDFSEKSVDGQ